MTKILIDTDVVLDFFLDREPFSSDAAKIFSLCETRKIKGFITPVILSNTYYLLRKFASHEKVIAKLKLLVSIVDILQIDKKAIAGALESSFKDFEDAIQNYSAELSGDISTIITRNTKDYKESKLAIYTPPNFIELMV
jgi:predicted nucleic acid-binding protein